jgi:hypothetical protein
VNSDPPNSIQKDAAGEAAIRAAGMEAEAAPEDVHDQLLSEASISSQKAHPGRKKKKDQPQNKWKMHP